MKKNSIFFFLIFYLFLCNANSENLLSCGNNFNHKFLSKLDDIKINSIEIKVKNYRKWSKNGVKILIDSSRNTPEKFKKRFAAEIIVNYEGDLKCRFPGKIRHHGDFKDHIIVSSNSFIQSLDVHLESGNIKGITKFKLLLKNTRGKYEDEILMTELLRNFNYLSPRTSFIKAKINEIDTEVIFQEKAEKELLEFNHRREGPIFEGQEIYMFKLAENIKRDEKNNSDSGLYTLMQKGVNGQLAKQINTNWNNNGKTFSSISHHAISNLNLAYLLYINGYQDKKNNSNFNSYNLNNTLLALNDPKNTLKLEIYNLLMFAANGSHGMAPYNRKFYWNSLENYFEPINYDSGFDIDDKPYYFYLPFNDHTIQAFKNLDVLLSNVNIKELQKKIKLSGIKLSYDQVQNKINKIRKNLNSYKNKYNKIEPNLLKYNSNYNLKNKMWNSYASSLNKIDPNISILYSEASKINKNLREFYECNTEDLGCKKINLTTDQKNELFKGNLNISNKNYQYIGENFKINTISNISKFNKKTINDSNFYYDKNIDFDFDEINKVLNIYQKKPGSKAFFRQGSIKDISINFYGYKDEKNSDILNFPIDENNLTGCLSLINLNIKDVSISIDNSNCEDSLNLINVNGNINKININNSYSDGLDIDFSKVFIDNINVISSRNDCVDFSSGTYKVNKLNLINCGDKALSIGEKSFLELNQIIIENSNIGIASKDSSISKLNKVHIKNTEICIAAYNKKQEFFGSLVEVKSIKCENYSKKIDVDKSSKIIVENNL